MKKIFGLLLVLVFLVTDVAKAESDNSAHYKRALSIITDIYDPNKTVDALETIKAFPTREARQILMFQIERVLEIKNDNTQQAEVYDKVLYRYVEAMGHVGVLGDENLLKKVDDGKNLDMTTAVLQAILGIRQRGIKLDDLPHFDKTLTISKIISSKLLLKSSPQGKVKALEQVLTERIVGQEEVVELLTTLFTKDLFYNGVRQAPEVLYMLGLPGNGKDTIAETFVDAMYNQEGASKDHMFRLNITTENDLWSYLGSGKGYVGSGELPDFLKFLAEHSGGKYRVVEEQSARETRNVIEKNPDWSPEKSNSQTSPHRAVVFVNEAHNLPKSVKDKLLKQAIERGIFPINNPGTGNNAVSTIEVPVTFIFASNEGIELLEPREANGERSGPPLSYDELIENYSKVANDKSKLKRALQKTNGRKNTPFLGKDAPGVSEEFLSRIPENRIVILKPLSQDQLKKIAKMRISKEARKLSNGSSDWGSLDVEVSDKVIDFIVKYKYIASENARPIENRVSEFIFSPLFEALKRGKIKSTQGNTQNIHVDLKEYANGTVAVRFSIESQEGSYSFNRIVRSTLSNIPPEPLSDERVSELLKMEERMNANVFGVEHISKRLAESAVVAESKSRSGAARPATVMAFLGKTSTGKTEAAKQYIKARYGDKVEPAIIDFNKIQTVQDMKAKITGSYDGNNDFIPSEFMKAYDRANGNIAFIFDESANSPKELLKALYEVLREATVYGFSDGKPRAMTNVTIILTGNAGEKIYNAIPNGLSPQMREKAAHEIFKIFMKDEDLQRNLLLEVFPDALLARLGRNIFFFGPHVPYTKRQLTQLKLKQLLKSMVPKASERGWNIEFATEQDIIKLLDLIEFEGFKESEQGASIDKYVRDEIGNKLEVALLSANIKSGSQITLSIDHGPETIGKNKHYSLNVTTQEGQKVAVNIPSVNKFYEPKTTRQAQVLTAYHEAGHEIVSEVYFGDRIRPEFLSIVPGITRIGNEIIHYAGVKKGRVEVQTETTKEVVLREVAILLAGYVAEELVTLGARNHEGKRNDIMRASNAIMTAILKYGLSKNWGMRAVPSGVSISDYVSKELSESEKEKLHTEVNQWLLEAEKLARNALLVNFEKCFVPMAKLIAQEGYLIGAEIEDFYEQKPSITERSPEYKDKVAEIEKLRGIIESGLSKKARHVSLAASDFDAEKIYNSLTTEKRNILTRFLKSKPNPKTWSELNQEERTLLSVIISEKVTDDSRDARLLLDSLDMTDVADVDELVKKEIKRETTRATNTKEFKIREAQTGNCKNMFL